MDEAKMLYKINKNNHLTKTSESFFSFHSMWFLVSLTPTIKGNKWSEWLNCADIFAQPALPEYMHNFTYTYCRSIQKCGFLMHTVDLLCEY